MTDYTKTLIRCSCIGALMTEPKDAAAKKAGELSKTAQTYLIAKYVQERYGREKDITTKQMAKGIEGEQAGIDMLSEYCGQELTKNEVRFSNEYLDGTPDILTERDNGLYIIDTKLSWDIWTFLPNIMESLNKDYYGQIQGYFAITGAKSGEITYLLVDTPENIITDEKYRLLRRMNVISEEAPEYQEAAAQLEINMIYPDIPIAEKVLTFPVERDDEFIEKVYQKVEKAREFLEIFGEKHRNFNKNSTFE